MILYYDRYTIWLYKLHLHRKRHHHIPSNCHQGNYLSHNGTVRSALTIYDDEVMPHNTHHTLYDYPKHVAHVRQRTLRKSATDRASSNRIYWQTHIYQRDAVQPYIAVGSRGLGPLSHTHKQTHKHLKLVNKRCITTHPALYTIMPRMKTIVE